MMKLDDIYNDFNATIHDCFLKKVTENLDSFEDPEIANFIKAGYNKDDPNALRMATIFNSIFTHQTTTFMITRSTASNLFEEDTHSKYNSCNSESYKILISYMINSGNFVCLEEQVGKKSGVYELVCKPLVDKLIYMCGLETINAKKNKVREFYHKDDSKHEKGSMKKLMKESLMKKGYYDE